MQSLLKDAKAKIEVKIVDAESAAAEEEDGDGKFTSAKIEMKGVEGSKVISMNTSALQNKLQSIQIIRSIAHSLGPTFKSQISEMVTLIT
jgi:hypothetical protein